MNYSELDLKVEKIEKEIKSQKSLKNAVLHFNKSDEQILEVHLKIKGLKKILNVLYSEYPLFENMYINPLECTQDFYSNW